jgi:hypothetical protein
VGPTSVRTNCFAWPRAASTRYCGDQWHPSASRATESGVAARTRVMTRSARACSAKSNSPGFSVGEGRANLPKMRKWSPGWIHNAWPCTESWHMPLAGRQVLPSRIPMALTRRRLCSPVGIARSALRGGAATRSADSQATTSMHEGCGSYVAYRASSSAPKSNQFKWCHAAPASAADANTSQPAVRLYRYRQAQTHTDKEVPPTSPHAAHA